MKTATRRELLVGIGRRTAAAAVGLALVDELGFAEALRASDPERLRFGALDPLVDLLQATPADELLPRVIARLRTGTPLADVVAAAALANARAHGGTYYDGYHALMAMVPSLEMAGQRTGPEAPLPVLKVVHRNARFIQKAGRADQDALLPLAPADESPDGLGEGDAGGTLVDLVRRHDLPRAERRLAELLAGGSRARERAYEELQAAVRDDLNVHRIVLSWRAWDLLRLTGDEPAPTLWRQCVRFCIDEDEQRVGRGKEPNGIRALLPGLLREHGLDRPPTSTHRVNEASIEDLAVVVFSAPPEQAADAVARSLADGTDPEDVGAAFSLAATRLLLNDPGRAQAAPGKPVGSVHGASVGVHASDAANAWRHVARIGSATSRHASLIAGAYHTAGQSQYVGELSHDHETPPCALEEPAELLAELEGRVREGDQKGASRAARRYASLGHDARDLFARLLPFAVDQDGALHAEKYFRTAQEEHALARPTHKGLYLAALARVVASQEGFPAPGVAEARELLGG